jgi:hypothetical protein
LEKLPSLLQDGWVTVFTVAHQNRAFRVFNKESKQDRYTSKKLLEKAFPAVPYSENNTLTSKGINPL